MIFLPKCRAFYVVLEKGHGMEKRAWCWRKGHVATPCLNWLGETLRADSQKTALTSFFSSFFFKSTYFTVLQMVSNGYFK